MKNSKTKYAVLGVISLLGPMSGYDIKKFCDQAISYFWNENFGHIYPVLAQLESDGLIIRSDSGEDSRKKSYLITDDGRKELKEWLVEPVEYQPERSELLLKLTFGNQMQDKDIISMLEAAKSRNQSKFEQLSGIYDYYLTNDEAKKKPQYPYWLATLRYGITSLEASLKWFDETLDFINKYNKENET
ncbi:MAG TPA: PadR family transcriptional regulator [Ruminiclostridium sp.]|nr:PadR family transcriptional regulator [Ruminiclostridium sp.]